MTSIAELFQQRKSHFYRNYIDSDLDSSRLPADLISRYTHRYGNSRRHNRQYNVRRALHEEDDANTLRRSPHLAQSSHCPSVLGRDSLRLYEGSSLSALGDITNLESISTPNGRLRFREEDRLPGAVILARERLLQRLRNASLSENRQNTSSDIHLDIFPSFNNVIFSRSRGRDRETEISEEWLGRNTSIPESHSRIDLVPVLRGKSIQSAGLSEAELECLHVEIFSNAKATNEHLTTNESQDCSICLESYQEGDKLIGLPCEHRFHSSCLCPWVQTCRFCPYCRRGITI